MKKYDIRDDLYNEVGEILRLESEYRLNSFKTSIYNELLNQLDITTYENINIVSISMLLNMIFDEKEASRIVERIVMYSTKLVQLEKLELKDTIEYETTLNKYDFLFDKLNEEYTRLCHRNSYLKKTLKEEKELKTIYLQIISKFKYGGIISEDELVVMDLLMQKNEVDLDNIIKVKEYVRYHNSIEKNPNFKFSKTILNMLDGKAKALEITKEEENRYGEKLSSVAISYFSSTMKYDEEYIDILKELKEQYDINEYLYILRKIVNILVENQLNNTNDMKETYDDEILRKVTIATFHELGTKIYFIKKLYYDTLNEYKMMLRDIKEAKEVEDSLDVEVKTNIYYFAKGEESFLEKDLKSNIREEKLSEVLELLNDKKYDTLTRDEDKQFANNSKLKQFRELRGDQVRIIYHNLNGNNILVIGAIIKKDNNDAEACERIAARISESDLKYYNDNLNKIDSKEIEEKIINYIENNKRKGSR